MAKRRIANEHRDFEAAKYLAKSFGITARIVSEDTLKWEASLRGVEGTPYEGGQYILCVIFPQDYPFKPPKIRFDTRVYHANINAKGGIDCDLLQDNWSPAMTITKVLITLATCFSSGGNPLDPLMPRRSHMMRNDMLTFVRNAAEWNHTHANGKSLEERGLAALKDGRVPTSEAERTVDRCIVRYYSKTQSQLLASLICSFCPLLRYHPFPYYVPWIAYIDRSDVAKYAKYDEELEERKVAMAKYDVMRFGSAEERDLVTDGQLMQIFIRSLTGTTFEINVYPSDYSLCVKRLIEKLKGVPLDKVRLIYAGKELEDYHTLSDRNIESEATLHLLMRLR